MPSFNECAEKMIEKIKPLADGVTPVSISEEFTLVTINVISKVHSQCVCTYIRRHFQALPSHHQQVAFGSDFSDPEWQGVYKLKYSEGKQGLFYLVSHALRGAQLSLAMPLFRVKLIDKCEML